MPTGELWSWETQALERLVLPEVGLGITGAGVLPALSRCQVPTDVPYCIAASQLATHVVSPAACPALECGICLRTACSAGVLPQDVPRLCLRKPEPFRNPGRFFCTYGQNLEKPPGLGSCVHGFLAQLRKNLPHQQRLAKTAWDKLLAPSFLVFQLLEAHFLE